MNVVPVTEALGLKCPDCGTQLQDRIGPFWCPGCEQDVSSWRMLMSLPGPPDLDGA